ncbi:hypothetical protein L915_01747 [Phytophthora nicotianae]|nr:hypothetical protein L915_01747 [Phytophthora nicotianae]
MFNSVDGQASHWTQRGDLQRGCFRAQLKNALSMVLVFIYDSQIWLAIAQAIVGAWIGFRLKIDHSARIKEFVKRLQQAPNFFPAIVELCCS